MRLDRWVTTSGDTFTFPVVQPTISQQIRVARDGVTLPGAVGTWPALGDDNPVQELSVRATLQFAWGQTVNGDALTSWAAMVQAVDDCCQALLSGSGQLYAVREDGEYVWAWAKCTGFERPSLANRRRLVEIPVQFVIEDTWYSDLLAGAWAFDDGSFLDSGLYFDATDLEFTGVITSEALTVPNTGTAPARAMTITITTASGSVVDPKLANAANGQWVQWTGTVGADAVTIQPGIFSILHGTVDAYDDLSIGTAQVEWMRFEPGTNVVTFTCSGGGAADITLEFYPPYHQA